MSAGDIVVAVIGIAVVVAVVVWFFLTRSPADLEGTDPDGARGPARPGAPERSTFGPAGPGAEAEGVADPGSPAPGDADGHPGRSGGR